ncbi:MAG: polyphosphate kinase 2 [Steroidobacteraceae bacterium]
MAVIDDSQLQALYDYLGDSLESPDLSPPVLDARPIEDFAAADEQTRRRYFLKNWYPHAEPISLRDYYRSKHLLQIELVKMQNWVKEARQKVVILVEGRDAAGKGGTIKRFTEHLNPRGVRVVALDKPDEEDAHRWYFQRYVQHLPTMGEIVFFDRSWYNRAGVERVMGFCTEEEYAAFMRQAPRFEEMLVQSGISLIKLYFSVARAEQARRFDERKANPLKHWKLSPIDLEAQRRWDAYTEAKEEMFRDTDVAAAPWTIIKADDKLRARLNAMRYVLHTLPYDGKDTKTIGDVDPWLVAAASFVFGESGPKSRL